MQRTPKGTALLTLAALTAAILWRTTHQPQPHSAPTAPAAPMQQEPLLMLWAWETPEDLTTLNPSKAGVAFLSREILLSDHLQLRLRHQPLLVADGAWLMAVVRIETAPTFTPTPALIAATANAIAIAAQQPNVRALQIDFDATTSQRTVYAAVLHQLRPQIPPNMPLSITSLVSWCGDHSWLHPLPIDEAVPMFFRMGGTPTSRALIPKDASLVHEPLCSGSTGISTDEPWPSIHTRERVYAFHPGPWTQLDIAHIDAIGYQGLIGDMQR